MSVIPNSADYVRLIRSGDARLLVRALARLDDVQVAALLEPLDSREQDSILHMLPIERRSEVLASMRYEIAAQVIGRLAPEEAAKLLDNLESDDVADILGQIDKEQLRPILARLDDADAKELEELLAYPENSAGGIMSLDVARIHEDVTIAEATRMLQQEAERLPGSVFYIYVVDEQERLVGVVSLRKLVISKPDQPIHAIMETELVYVTVETHQEKVAELASRYDLVAIPVVDDQRRLLGAVTIDDIVDVLREEATEDILKMAGAGEELAETRAFRASFRARMPWLLTSACGGMIVALSLQGFEDALSGMPALAFFMPVVAGMGGNVGTQSSTIMVRGLAVGFVESSRFGSLVLREIAIGAAMGAIYGAGIALLSPLVGASASDPLGLGLVITFGMMGSMVIAATVGAAVPLLLHRLNIDPAVATGPFVTTSVDILGLLFYFWLSTHLLGVSL